MKVDCRNCFHYVEGKALICAEENSKWIEIKKCDIGLETSHNHECATFVNKYLVGK